VRENVWFKSSRSNGGDCVEVQWHTAAGCYDSNCVEVGFQTASACDDNGCVGVHLGEDEILLRDTKDGGKGPVLKFTPSEWEAFVGGVKLGEFDF
jgi:uncharacterized protein DUF397